MTTYVLKDWNLLQVGAAGGRVDFTDYVQVVSGKEEFQKWCYDQEFRLVT